MEIWPPYLLNWRRYLLSNTAICWIAWHQTTDSKYAECSLYFLHILGCLQLSQVLSTVLMLCGIPRQWHTCQFAAYHNVKQTLIDIYTRHSRAVNVSTCCEYPRAAGVALSGTVLTMSASTLASTASCRPHLSRTVYTICPLHYNSNALTNPANDTIQLTATVGYSSDEVT